MSCTIHVRLANLWIMWSPQTQHCKGFISIIRVFLSVFACLKRRKKSYQSCRVKLSVLKNLALGSTFLSSIFFCFVLFGCCLPVVWIAEFSFKKRAERLGNVTLTPYLFCGWVVLCCVEPLNTCSIWAPWKELVSTQGSAHLPSYLSAFQLCCVFLKSFLLFIKREREWFHDLTQLEGALVAQAFCLPGEFLSDAEQTQLFPSSHQLSSAFRTTEKTAVWEGVWQLSLRKWEIFTTFPAHPDYAVLKFMLLLSSWVTVSGSRGRLSLTVGKGWREMSHSFSALSYFLMPLDGRHRKA